jgi:hypothetical protein
MEAAADGQQVSINAWPARAMDERSGRVHPGSMGTHGALASRAKQKRAARQFPAYLSRRS